MYRYCDGGRGGSGGGPIFFGEELMVALRNTPGFLDGVVSYGKSSATPSCNLSGR
jgi:hypothetical protein